MAARGGDWLVAVAGSLLFHAAILSFAAAPSFFGGAGGARAGEGASPAAAPKGVPAQAEPLPGDAHSPASPAGSAARPAPQRPSSPARSTCPASAVPGEASPSAGSVPERPDVHVVRQGDTITKIARLYGMDVEEIARANGKPLSRLNNIWVGQKIKLK